MDKRQQQIQYLWSIMTQLSGTDTAMRQQKSVKDTWTDVGIHTRRKPFDGETGSVNLFMEIKLG